MIDIERFSAVNDKRPGHQGFRVTGSVAVAHPGITPVLVEPEVRHKGGWEVLHLELHIDDGIYVQVETDKTVCFERATGTGWQAVEIHHGDGSIRLPITTLE